MPRLKTKFKYYNASRLHCGIREILNTPRSWLKACTVGIILKWSASTISLNVAAKRAVPVGLLVTEQL